MTYCLSVKDIYGTDLPKVPEGYKLTGEFRPPLRGEMFISLVPPNLADVYPNNDAPKQVVRLILEKLPPKPTIESIYGTKEPKIPEGYESTGEFRSAKLGEYSLVRGIPNCVYKNTVTDDLPSYPRVILRKVKTYSDAEINDFLIDLITSSCLYSGLGIPYTRVTKAKIIEKMREKGI